LTAIKSNSNIKKTDEIRMLVHIKEIIKKKKNKTDFSQHSCMISERERERVLTKFNSS
jgi:fructose-1-phosphate kinase PfkB-like protein